MENSQKVLEIYMDNSRKVLEIYMENPQKVLDHGGASVVRYLFSIVPMDFSKRCLDMEWKSREEMVL